MAAAAPTSGVDENGIKHVDITVDYAGEERDASLQAVVRALCGWGGEGITIKVIGGGITNLLFKLAQEGRSDVLVRVFGAKTEMMIERERDNRKWLVSKFRQRFNSPRQPPQCCFTASPRQALALPCMDTSLMVALRAGSSPLLWSLPK